MKRWNFLFIFTLQNVVLNVEFRCQNLRKVLVNKGWSQIQYGEFTIKLAVVVFSTHFVCCMRHNIGKILMDGKLIKTVPLYLRGRFCIMLWSQ